MNRVYGPVLFTMCSGENSTREAVGSGGPGFTVTQDTALYFHPARPVTCRASVHLCCCFTLWAGVAEFKPVSTPGKVRRSKAPIFLVSDQSCHLA